MANETVERHMTGVKFSDGEGGTMFVCKEDGKFHVRLNDDGREVTMLLDHDDAKALAAFMFKFFSGVVGEGKDA